MWKYRVYIVHSGFASEVCGGLFEILVVIIIEIWAHIAKQYYTVVMQPPSSMEQIRLNQEKFTVMQIVYTQEVTNTGNDHMEYFRHACII